MRQQMWVIIDSRSVLKPQLENKGRHFYMKGLIPQRFILSTLLTLLLTFGVQGITDALDPGYYHSYRSVAHA